MNVDEGPGTDLKNRYGPKKPRIPSKTLLAISTILLLGFFWVAFLMPRQYITGTTISYSVIDHKHVDLTVSITNTNNSPFRCTFQALDDSFNVVGWKEKKYSAVGDVHRDTVHIRTERPAVSANVKECRSI